MSLKTGTTLGLIAFGVTLAYYVSNRLSADALNFAVGVLCGIAASVPVSLGLLAALGRERESSETFGPTEYPQRSQAYGGARPPTPQVIVIPPPQAQYNPGAAPFGYSAAGPVPYASYPSRESDRIIEGRDWRIIGDK
jgi:hypothetical protein